MGDFAKVGKLSEFREGRGRAVMLDDVRVAVFKLRGRLYALQDACPHMGAALSDGKLDGDAVVCHWHDWKFDLRSGQGDQRKWACARVYEVRVDGEEVFLRRPDPEPEAVEPEEEWIVWKDDYLKPSSDDR